MNKLRKFLVIGVMVMTVFATMGMVTPQVEAAASAGDLIKMDGLSSVYYLGADGKRYVFPNTDTYMSWYSDFSGVVTIPAAELQSYPLGGNVVMRPGTKLVKITTDPTVYAVEPNGTLRSIVSEANAIALYGTNWNKRIVDVPDAFFTNYTISSPLTVGQVPAGSLVKSAASADVYYYDGTNYRAIASEAAFHANRFQFSNVLTVSNAITAGGTAIATAELVNVAQGGTPTGPVVTGSGLMVSLNAATPVSASVPKNGSRVAMAKVNLTAANDGAVTVNSITVKRIGLSVYSAIDKVWAEQNGVVVASKKSMNSNDESILTFSPALTISAGQTVALDIYVSLTGTSTGNIGLSIASASAVSATAASVSGSFPINGNIMSPTEYNVATLSISTSSAATSVKVGDEKADLAAFTLALAGASADQRDVVLKSITFKNNGVEDLSKTTMNVYLEQAGQKVSSSAVVDGRFITVYFNSGYELLKNDSSKLFYLKGDIISKENSGTPSYNFVLAKGTDLVAEEKATGFGVNVNSDNVALNSFDITAGAVTVSKKSTSPSAANIVKGWDGTILLANIKADEAITADGLVLQYSSAEGGFATTTDKFENVRVYLNGVLLDSFDPSASSTVALTHTIDSTYTLNKGDNELKVVAKAKSNATNGILTVKVVGGTSAGEMFYGMNPEYVVSGNVVTSGIGGSATSGTVTVATASLVTVRNDGYSASKAIVKGSSDVSLGKFTVKAENDKARVTSIAFGANAGSVLSGSIYDMKLYVDGALVSGPSNFGVSGVNFSSLNFEIAKDSTKNVELFGSFDSSASGTFETLMTVNAVDSYGSSITSGTRTASTTSFAVSDAGTLNIEIGGDTPVAGVLAAKAGVEQEVAHIKFTAVTDSANLTEINIINDNGSGAATSSADSRISAIKLYDGTTLIDSFVPVNGAGKFTINNKVNIAANSNKTLSVKVVLNNIENDASSTDKVLTIGIGDVKSKSSSGAESTTADANKKANSFLIRKTVPTVAFLALDDKALTAGEKTIAKFTVTADANGDVKLGRLTLTVATTTSSTISTSTTPLKVNGSNKSGATATLTGNKMLVEFSSETVAAGTSKTFEVAAIVGSSNSNQSVTARILEDASYDADTSLAGVTGEFVWSDGASITAETWNTGHTIKGLPTTTWVLSN